MAKKVKLTPIDERIIKVENEFSIKNAGEIAQQLKRNLGNARAAVVRLEHIEQLDLSALQVIHALRKYAEKKNLALKVETQLSEEVKALISHAGFSDFF